MLTTLMSTKGIAYVSFFLMQIKLTAQEEVALELRASQVGAISLGLKRA